MQFWLRDEQVKPQQRRDRSGPRARKASDVRETNALMVTLIESDSKCPRKEAIQTTLPKNPYTFYGPRATLSFQSAHTR